MIPARFDYVRAASAQEAAAALAEHGDEAKVLAGGQTLLPLLRLRLSYPTVLVDVSRAADMRGVREESDRLVVGAATPHSDVLTDPLIRRHAPLVAQATATVADPAVRHLGTFGGALTHADPAGDLLAVALALDAEMTIAGPAGSRTVAARDFFEDYLQTAVGTEEVLTEIRIPKLTAGWGVHYEKFHRVAQAWAVVGVAALVRRDNGSIAEARIGLTNMGPVPVRASATEQALVGAAAEEPAIAAAAEHAADGTRPPSDLNGQADYRAHLARVLTRRAVAAAAAG